MHAHKNSNQIQTNQTIKPPMTEGSTPIPPINPGLGGKNHFPPPCLPRFPLPCVCPPSSIFFIFFSSSFPCARIPGFKIGRAPRIAKPEIHMSENCNHNKQSTPNRDRDPLLPHPPPPPPHARTRHRATPPPALASARVFVVLSVFARGPKSTPSLPPRSTLPPPYT